MGTYKLIIFNTTSNAYNRLNLREKLKKIYLETDYHILVSS